MEIRKKLSYEMEHKKEILVSIDEKIKELNVVLGAIFREITEFRKDITLSISFENIKEAYHASLELLDCIYHLEKISDKLKNNQELLSIKQEAIEEITSRIDDILYDIHEKELEISKQKKENKI